MTSIDLLLDAVEGSTCPESINLVGTGLWNLQDFNRWSLPTVLEFGSRNMTAQKLHRTERSDSRVRELASRLSLEEQVCSDFNTLQAHLQPILHRDGDGLQVLDQLLDNSQLEVADFLVSGIIL